MTTYPLGGTCPLIELRQYLLHPGARDTLIALFDREFVESQEAVGIQLIAQFRDLDRPDVFTWIRGFDDMPSRADALAAFYDGRVWGRHRDAANATMMDSDNVRLLHPTHGLSGLPLDEVRPGPGVTAIRTGLVVATIYTLSASAAADFSDWFHTEVEPLLFATGGVPIGVYETEPAVNTFPRLPVREGEHAFVWFARFTNVAAHDRHLAALRALPRWEGEIVPELARRSAAPVEVWRLAPTARSRTFRPGPLPRGIWVKDRVEGLGSRV